MHIAIDAMGGDFAPHSTVKGAYEAEKELNIDIILVGIKEKIEQELNKYKSSKRITIYSATEVIEMSEPPAVSIRKKKDSSICVGVDLLKKAEAEAFVSAGNTGAVVCSATLSLGLLPGIERPGIAIPIPTLKGISLLIDVGANIDPKPMHLLHYGLMADSYMRYILNVKNPKVGLLNIGEEETKGTDFVKETHRLLDESHLNFIGNIEGKDIFKGICDCIICDGFVGNVALKVSESFAEAINGFLRRELRKNIMGSIGLYLIGRNLRRFRKGIDYTEYGGALLLGVNGITIIAHGRSSSKAIKNAIRVAKQEVENKVNEKIIEAISSFKMNKI